MRVLVAPQEFKGTLTAVEAAAAMARGLRAAFPDIELDLLPMADGGPGTAAALLAALGGETRRAPAHDPLLRPIEAEWALLADGRGVVECAAASGLLRLGEGELTPANARRASSRGTGELIAAALDAGVEDLVVGLGGSATTDGGAGMAEALGYRLLDAAGRPLPPGGAALARLHAIDPGRRDPRLERLRCAGATDVSNPLCGPEGAAAVYGPQKGADARAVADLDAALRRFAEVVRRDLGIGVRDRPGAGAAGGLGAGLIAFLGAELGSGAEVVGRAAGAAARVRAADLVIAGEGRLDGQTAYGKAPRYLAGLAAAAGKPAACIAGRLGEGADTVVPLFAAVEALTRPGDPLPAPREAADAVAAASVRAVRALLVRGLLVRPGDL